MINVRPMITGEEAIVSGLILTTFNNFIAKDYDEKGVKNFCEYSNAKNIKKRQTIDHFVLVAVCDERIVGVIEVRSNQHISLMFVLRDYQNKGIATRLVDGALAKCLENSPLLKCISVSSSKQAQGFYKKVGFKLASDLKKIDGIIFYEMILNIPTRFSGKNFEWIFDRPYILGTINTNLIKTDDGYKNTNLKAMAYLAKEMIEKGADALEISTQTMDESGYKLSPTEEWRGLEDIIKVVVRSERPVFVNTAYPEVAKKALALGAAAISDSSGVVFSSMAEIISNYKAGWVLTHILNPGKLVAPSVHNTAEELISQALDLNVNRANLCVNIGIGLNKNTNQNLNLINNASLARVEGFPLLLDVTNLYATTEVGDRAKLGDIYISEILAYNHCYLNNVDIIKANDISTVMETLKIAKSFASGKAYEGN